MNIYDVFRRMIEGRPFQDFERTEALKLLDNLESMNVLGTVARTTTEGHEHQWIEWKTTPQRFTYVNGRYEPEQAKTYWRRCQICSLEEAIK